jgi:hypothetical protein
VQPRTSKGHHRPVIAENFLVFLNKLNIVFLRSKNETIQKDE